jgi:transketolase C-terminal domain/subunit
VFGESGEPEELKVKYGLTKEKIMEASLKAIGRKRP